MLSNCKSQNSLWHAVCGNDHSYKWRLCLCTTVVLVVLQIVFLLWNTKAGKGLKCLQVLHICVWWHFCCHASKIWTCDLYIFNSTCSKCCCYFSSARSDCVLFLSSIFKLKQVWELKTIFVQFSPFFFLFFHPKLYFWCNPAVSLADMYVVSSWFSVFVSSNKSE